MTTGERTGEGSDWEPTHEIVSTGDLADEVAADTRLVAVASEFGDEGVLTMTTDDISDRSPRTQRILDGELVRVDDGTDPNRVGGEAAAAFAGPTWRAPLPGDADALVRALTVADSEVDGALGEARWRVWDLQRVEVRRDGRPIYRSVPHHSLFELDASELPSFPDRARERLVDLSCAVVPAGPVATWPDGGELTHRTLRFGTGSGVSLEHVRRVAVDRDRRELVVDWVPVRERVERESSRVLRAVLRAFAWTVDRLGGSADPPRRLSFADDDFRRAVEGIETVRERVGYDFAVVEV